MVYQASEHGRCVSIASSNVPTWERTVYLWGHLKSWTPGPRRASQLWVRTVLETDNMTLYRGQLRRMQDQSWPCYQPVMVVTILRVSVCACGCHMHYSAFSSSVSGIKTNCFSFLFQNKLALAYVFQKWLQYLEHPQKMYWNGKLATSCIIEH